MHLEPDTLGIDMPNTRDRLHKNHKLCIKNDENGK